MTGLATPERDAALSRLLASSAGDPDIWSVAALRRAAGEDADLMFPDGPPEMVEAWCDLGDRALLADASASGTASRARVPDRVREAILLRLATGRAHRDASRRALPVLARPGEAARGARVLARTADAIWRAAGDTSTGLSRHTRRATAGAVWSATLLYAFEHGDDDEAVAAFLDRRLAGVARINRLRRWFGGRAARPGPHGPEAVEPGDAGFRVVGLLDAPGPAHPEPGVAGSGHPASRMPGPDDPASVVPEPGDPASGVPGSGDPASVGPGSGTTPA